jgi:hypothetical protein
MRCVGRDIHPKFRENYCSQKRVHKGFPCDGCDLKEDPEIRWYKGKYKVEVLLKSRGNWRVRALETVSRSLLEGVSFVTIPRLLWRERRK